MAQPNNNVKVKTAKSKDNRFVLEFGHGTTNKFLEASVPFCMEVQRGTKMQIAMSALRRIDPMPLPPMSMVRFNTRFYYVPYIDICPYFEHLDAQTPYNFRYGTNANDYVAKIPTSVPILESLDIKSLLFGTLIAGYDYFTNLLTNQILYFARPTLGSENTDYLEWIPTRWNENITDIIAPEHYDIAIKFKASYVDPNNNNASVTTMNYFRFTPRGRILYKILKQLGYDFNINGAENINTLGYDKKNADNVSFSAMKLLAYTKVYLDYYESAAFYNNTVRLSRLNSLCHIDIDAYHLTVTDLDLICDLMTYTCYEYDYFTTSFVNPESGNNFLVNNQQITINDVATGGENIIYTDQNQNGTAEITDNSGNGFSQNGMNLLKRLTSYLKRMQVAGGRFVDRILAEYGIGVDNSYSRRTSYIDTIESVMNVTPVLNTTSQQLGDYGGFGSSWVDKNNVINVNCPDCTGVIIAIDSITPEIFYSQGYLRENRHITKFDFVTPEFDAVGVQAVEQGEILNIHDGKYSYAPSQQTFGYKPRYAEAKERYSYLTGDFLCDSVNTDIDSFFTDRRFDPENFNDNGDVNITTSRELCSTYDSGQYARIFYTNKRKTDYIKSIFRFHIEMTSPMQKLYAEYELNGENGSEVNMHVGGQIMA